MAIRGSLIDRAGTTHRSLKAVCAIISQVGSYKLQSAIAVVHSEALTIEIPPGITRKADLAIVGGCCTVSIMACPSLLR
jgi:hypothetical protein